MTDISKFEKILQASNHDEEMEFFELKDRLDKLLEASAPFGTNAVASATVLALFKVLKDSGCGFDEAVEEAIDLIRNVRPPLYKTL